MGEGQLGDVEATPQPEEPSGIDDAAVEQVLRRRRRGMVLTAFGVLAAYVALLVVLSLVQSAPPTRYAWEVLGIVVVLVVVFLWPLRSPAAREGAADRARRQIRIDAALRAH